MSGQLSNKIMLNYFNSQEFKAELEEIGLDEKSREILILFLNMYKNLKDNSFVRKLILNYLFS